MPQGTVLKTSSYCKSMEKFQQRLAGEIINSIEVAAASTVRSCSQPKVANDIASAFSVCRDSILCQTQTFICSGNEWTVGTCGQGGEIKVGAATDKTACQCSNADVVIRPCVGNGPHWLSLIHI